MALVAVLWVVLLLSVVATTVATQSIDGRRVAVRSTEAARLDASADSAIRQTLIQLIANLRNPERPMPVGGEFVVGEDAVQVQVDRESARLDLNTADENLLIEYFMSAGWQDTAARSMVERIRDWQDPDDVAREQGLERDGYISQRLAPTPRNGFMESVEEVRLVAGAELLTDELLRGLTVYTHLPATDAGDPQRVPAGGLARLRACTRKEPAARCREAVVRLTGGTLEPVQVFLWRSVAQR